MTGMGENQPAFENLVLWIEAETGLCFPEAHHDTILRAAQRHCAGLGLEPGGYERLMHADAAVRQAFLDDIMIGETYFFRDEKHFSVLLDQVLPALAASGSSLRLWSVTAASGEEALSLLAILEHFRETRMPDLDYSILATDINTQALERLSRGDFPLSSFRTDGRRWHGLLDACGQRHADLWRCRPDLLGRIRTQPFNLLGKAWPDPASMDLVFFRNTLVYMKQRQKEQIIDRLVATMKPGACLFLASPELPTVRHPELRVQEAMASFYFQKIVTTDKTRSANQGSANQGSANPSSANPSSAHPPTKPARQVAVAGSRRTAEPVRQRQPAFLQSDLRAGLLLLAAAGGAGRELSGNPSCDPGGVSGDELSHGPGASQAAAAEPPASWPAHVAALLDRCLRAIQENQFAAAQAAVVCMEAFAQENYLGCYLRGTIYKHQDDPQAAMAMFEKARLYRRDFWPALFQLALCLLAEDPGRSRGLLLECRRLIVQDPDSSLYSLLLDGFEVSYFARMVTRMLERLSAQDHVMED